MKAQSLRWNQPWRQLAGMQANMHFWIKFMQIAQNLHVKIEVAHGHIPVFRHDQVKSHNPRIAGRKLETGENLCKHLLRRKASQDLIQISNRNLTTGSRECRATTKFLPRGLLFAIKLVACLCDRILQPGGKKLFTHGAEIGIPSNLSA